MLQRHHTSFDTVCRHARDGSFGSGSEQSLPIIPPRAAGPGGWKRGEETNDWGDFYQPRKRTFDPGRREGSWLRNTSVVGGGPLAVMDILSRGLIQHLDLGLDLDFEG